MLLEGFLQARRERGRIEQERSELLLRRARQTDDFDFSDRLPRCLLRRRHDEVADRAPLDLGGAFHQFQPFRRDACLQTRVSSFSHGVTSLTQCTVKYRTLQAACGSRRSPLSVTYSSTAS